LALTDDRPDDADAGVPADLLTNLEIDLKRELRAARIFAIRDSFGGESVYRLLKERNPQIDIILNAGILAGIRQTDLIRLDAAWQEDAWRIFRELEK
jgi:hypothetical protein